MSEFAIARTFMVEGQIRPNKVTDPRLVEALTLIPRERFVQGAARAVAYVDEDLPIAPGRFLLEPMVLARMFQEAGIDADDAVLDVGCGTGYSTAVLAKLAGRVVGLECDAALAERASVALAELGLSSNVEIVTGALPAGHAAAGPYDVIVVNGAVAQTPDGLAAQLKDGGRMVVTVLGYRGLGEVRLYRRGGAAVSSRVVFEAQSHLLPGFEPKPTFQF